MFQNAPWLGNGPSTYKTLYPVYIQTMNFPEWVVMDPWGGAVPWAHNLYLELLAERGMDPVAVPLADGGEGTTLALISQLQVGTD